MPVSPPLSRLISEIRDDLRTMPAIARLYDDVPESLNEYPAVVVAPSSGSCWLGSHANANEKSPMWCRHVIHVEVHVPRKNLPDDVEKLTTAGAVLLPWLYEGFVRDRWGHTVVSTGDPRTSQNATAPLTYEIQEGIWGDQPTLKWVTDVEITTEQELEP